MILLCRLVICYMTHVTSARAVIAGQYNIEKNKNGNIRLFWERLDAPHSFSTSEAPPKGPSVTDATFSPCPGNQNGHLASTCKRSRKSAIFSLLSDKHSAACAAVAAAAARCAPQRTGSRLFPPPPARPPPPGPKNTEAAAPVRIDPAQTKARVSRLTPLIECFWHFVPPPPQHCSLC
jgi:hypothetical protein